MRESYARKIINAGENFTAYPREAAKYLASHVGAGPANLYKHLFDRPEGFNHYPKTLADELCVSVRTIQRWLRSLALAGAVRKLSKINPNGQPIYYYRPRIDPHRERQKTVATPKPARPTMAVDNSCKRAVQKPGETTKTAPLVRLINSPSKHTKPKTHTHSMYRSDQKINCEGGAMEKFIRAQFDWLCANYPGHKIPWENQRYMRATFKQFRQHVTDKSSEFVELFTDSLIDDVNNRLKQCYHWQTPEDVPMLYGYLADRRWLNPIQRPLHLVNERDKLMSTIGSPHTHQTPFDAAMATTGAEIGSDWAEQPLKLNRAGREIGFSAAKKIINDLEVKSR